MLHSYPLQLGATPLLLVSVDPPTDAARRGTVLLLHGLGAYKEINRPELERFAHAGFLAIGIDAVGHGERRFPDFDQRFAEGAPDRERALIDTVVATANELPGLIDLLEDAGLAHPDQVGLCGISMGGFAAYAAIASGRLAAAVALIASPLWRVEVPEHPMKHLDRFFPCALLSQVAGRDALVNPYEARDFHRMLQPRYEGAPERLAFVAYPESGHFMRPEDWDAALERASDWFRRHLRR